MQRLVSLSRPNDNDFYGMPSLVLGAQSKWLSRFLHSLVHVRHPEKVPTYLHERDPMFNLNSAIGCEQRRREDGKHVIRPANRKGSRAARTQPKR